MGLDIYFTIEACTSDDFSSPMGIAYMDAPRDSAMFRAMAGMHGSPCLIPARGFPDPASSLAYVHYGRFVVDDLDGADGCGAATISREWASEEISAGRSQWLPYIGDLVSAPQYVHASWLRLSELREAIKFASLEPSCLSFEIQMAMELMASIEKRGHASRIVFWFDE